MSAFAPDPLDARAERRDAFWADLHRSGLSSGLARFAPLALAVGVGAISVLAGQVAVAVATAAIAVLYLLVLRRTDRRRWQAQDTIHRYQALRSRRWMAETGGPSPVEQPGRVETWLATHPRGSVPQLYRAIAAAQSDDPVLARRELEAVETDTPLGRARLAWLQAATAIDRGERPDLAQLRALVDDLPTGPERAELGAFLAQAKAIDRHTAGDPAWLEPLAAERSGMPPVRRPVVASARLWLARLWAVLGFVVLGLVFASVAPSVFAERIPPEYAQTRLATRGEVPVHDSQAVVETLPTIARAVAAGTRVQPDALDELGWSELVDAGLPTLIWEVGAIDVAAPADAPGRLWQVEVPTGADDGVVLLTFDGGDGPVYAYRIDPAAVARVAAALGVP